jgi:hypothetical protein
MNRRRLATRIARMPLTVLLTLGTVTSASASVFCVDTAAELHAALATAETNGVEDHIKIEVGTYSANDGTSAFSYLATGHDALTITGDHIANSPNGCDLWLPGARMTTLSGLDARRVLRLSSGTGVARISVSDLIITRGDAAGSGGGIAVGVTGFRGDVTIERVTFHRNVASASGGGLSVITGGHVLVSNNVFSLNQSLSNGAIGVSIADENVGDAGLEFSSNTVFGNSCAAGCTTGGLRYTSEKAGLLLNNLFVGNDGADFETTSAATALVNNNIGGLLGTPPVTSVGNLALTEVGFVDDGGTVVDLHLADDSPVIDRGTEAFGVPPADLDGPTRIYGSHIDLGAYENKSFRFANSFESP